MIPSTALLEALPVPVYVTEADGRIVFYNDAAVELWGHRPEIGSARWSGAWRLYWPDGTPISHDQSPLALALRDGQTVSGVEVVAERPDGARVTFVPNPRLLKDGSGQVVGAINLLVDITGQKEAEIASARLAAIVSSSDDAIVSKTLGGVVTSWNQGAVRIFGYEPWEMIGQSIRKIVPPELQSEEDDILSRLGKGERIDHFETVRIGKDNRRIDVSVTISPIRDRCGALVGASKVARDIGERKRSEAASARLAAIVSSSDDAIISKNLDGVVTSWNAGAARIFGYAPEEMIGCSIRRVIPDDLQKEEDEILSRLRNGQRIEHFDTVRVAKDGRRVEVSLTISPMHDSTGQVVGASKVARDVTERKRAEELQHLLFQELNHRVKNTLATIQAIAGQSMRAAASPTDFVKSFSGRVQALGRAHDLLVQQRMSGASVKQLVRDQVVLGAAEGTDVTFAGPDVILDARIAVQLALVLHELATNARKYGALSVPGGALAVTWSVDSHNGREMHLKWQESGVPNITAPRSRGFGTTLIERSLVANQGEATLRYGTDGVTCEIRLPLTEASRPEPSEANTDEVAEFRPRKAPSYGVRGKRILLIEDEPLIAMQLESELVSEGFEVLGPAANIESAKRYIAQERYDAALLDANLAGDAVDELAAALAQRSIPFAFATGYGREGLPAAFRDAVMISKPFDPDKLIAAVRGLFDRDQHLSSEMVSLRAKEK